jgi:ABC-type Fe3+ transport system substrate-binding protein
MFRRSTLVFILFALIVAGLVGYSQFVQQQPPLEMTIAVNGLARDWVNAAATRFNATAPLINNGTTRVQIRVIDANDMDVWQGNSGWTLQNHPVLWLPASSMALNYRPNNLSFTTLEISTARTPLVWGGFSSRVAVITKDGQRPFDWGAVNEILAAQRWQNLGAPANWGNVNMAINDPTDSIAGVAVLMSGAADLTGSGTLARDSVNSSDFNAWAAPLADSTRNLKTVTPAQRMAQPGGIANGFGLLPEVQWLTSLNDLNKQEPMVFHYPGFQFVLDFPLALWDDSQTTPAQREAAAAFAAFLTGTDGQQLAIENGLRPITNEPTAADAIFALAAPNGIELAPDYGLQITIPERSIVETLLRAVD